MCGICGCNEEHAINHHHEHPDIIQVGVDLLAKNNQFAAANRDYFAKKGITAINMMSSPGSGKTSLLTRTFAEQKHLARMAVIVGDQQTDFDAQRLKSAGAEAIQINTGQVCHLDAHSIGHTVEHLSHKDKGILFIENVGNLVCPALFDLGEKYKVVLLSVTEGDNKPLKYPQMFRHADLMILTKTDLLPYVEFDVDACIRYARRINPTIAILQVSATKGDGMQDWYAWLAGK